MCVCARALFDANVLNFDDLIMVGDDILLIRHVKEREGGGEIVNNANMTNGEFSWVASKGYLEVGKTFWKDNLESCFRYMSQTNMRNKKPLFMNDTRF